LESGKNQRIERIKMTEGLREFLDALLVLGVLLGCWLAIGLLGNGWSNTCIRFGIFWIRHGHATQRRHAAQAANLEKMLSGLGQAAAQGTKVRKSRSKPALVPIREREVEGLGK
jgi:hypothetical protein